MPSYLVTGASRGLGYEFVRQFSHDSANTVIGIVRDKTATERQLRDDGINNVSLFEADITDLDALKVRNLSKER
ncbi:hypothetical protein LSUB1_G003215 [Lachnellula subtilissima]|uniref:Ketoreductase (KR) domain-containing protein n=1 Tax=Lachnellula subtilissima TaxID=602034 RepID=A0A8H8RS94_9HELO|nr:hypothetical protein LSUB1_G003215 [Lachnellula subtilissima]